IGAFLGTGTTKAKPATTKPDRDFSRTGIDFQADLGGSRIQAAYIMAEDDNDINGTVTNKDKNNAYSLQYYYTMKTATGSPTLVPIVRLDSYEQNNGNDKYDELTLNLTYYFTENFKGFVEYWDQLSVPGTQVADNRTTVQFTVGF
ncbi:MAG: hypothetical protein ACC657_03890, partial [Thiohalomonadales bacterium]